MSLSRRASFAGSELKSEPTGGKHVRFLDVPTHENTANNEIPVDVEDNADKEHVLSGDVDVHNEEEAGDKGGTGDAEAVPGEDTADGEQAGQANTRPSNPRVRFDVESSSEGESGEDGAGEEEPGEELWTAYLDAIEVEDKANVEEWAKSSHTSTIFVRVGYRPRYSGAYFLDSGATCHVSPERSDFKTLVAIPPRAISGVGGSRIFATGIGDIQLQLARGHKLILKNVLFVADSSVRLVSVLALNRSGDFGTWFDSDGCAVMDRQSGAVLVRGSLFRNKLYRLNVSDSAASEHAFSAVRQPTLATWHARLGHANLRTVHKMAQGHAATGMSVDLSCEPGICEHCIQGKQTRATIPNEREGPRSTSRLQLVFVDLAGQDGLVSRTHNVYKMHIVDDYWGHTWVYTMPTKDRALPTLQTWVKYIELQTGDRVRAIQADKGELKSTAFVQWCADTGMDYRWTATDTSAQNGRVERVHRTLSNKGRTMRIACGAPPSFWDEFAHTAGYLHNLTPTQTLRWRTPHELFWHRRPDVSHLREIGCSATAYVTSHNPKVFARGVKCILIGYAAHSKAYRLWHTENGVHRVFESIHVKFVEAKDAAEILHPRRKPVDIPPDPEADWSAGQFATRRSAPEPPARLATEAASHPNEFEQDETPPPLPLVTEPLVMPPPSPQTPAVVSRPMTPPSPLTSEEESPSPQGSPVPPTPPRPPRSPSRPPPPAPSRPSRQRQPPPRFTVNDTSEPQLQRAVQEVRDAAERSKMAKALAKETPDLVQPPPITPGNRALARTLSNTLGTRVDPTQVEHALATYLEMFSVDDGTTAFEAAPADPLTWRECLDSPQRPEWIAGGWDEMKSLQHHKVYELVHRSQVPTGRRILRGKLVPRVKRDQFGRPVRYKVRYVVKGFEQMYGRDYDKTTAPTARLESFRALLHIAATNDWLLGQYDVATAFLYGVLSDEEEIYMEQPQGFEEPGKEEYVWRLRKGLYGLKQGSRVWNRTLNDAMLSWGYKRLECEWCVYVRTSDVGTSIIVVHVDDMISAFSTPAEKLLFETQLKARFTISELGDPAFALGIGISRDRAKRTVSLSQTALIDRVITSFGSDRPAADTPMRTDTKLSRPPPDEHLTPEELAEINELPYRPLVGSLMYIMAGTRPDIAFAVSLLSSYLNCYRREHWEAALRVVQYLKGTRSLQLVLGAPSGVVTLSGFTDSSYADCVDTRRSTGGYATFLGDNSAAITWCSRKQTDVADSTCVAEYVAAHEASKELVWLRSLLSGLGFAQLSATPLLCDNSAAVTLAGDQAFHKKVKHIDVRYHYLRELVARDTIIVSHVRSKANVADIFTKPLASGPFKLCRDMLGLRSPG